MRKTFFLEVCTRRLTLSFSNFPLSQNEGKWSFRSCTWKTFERISTPIEASWAKFASELLIKAFIKHCFPNERTENNLSDIRRLSQIQVFILRFRFQLKSTVPERAKRAKIHRLDLKTWSVGGALHGMTASIAFVRSLESLPRVKRENP